MGDLETQRPSPTLYNVGKLKYVLVFSRIFLTLRDNLAYSFQGK